MLAPGVLLRCVCLAVLLLCGVRGVHGAGEQIIIEETQRAGCGEWYNTLHSRLVGPYLQRFGNDEQRERFLPKCVSGECILAVGMTEPGAGSDLSGIRTTAKDMGDHFLAGCCVIMTWYVTATNPSQT